MTPERSRNLSRLLNPRHIAFIGGRDAEVAIGEAHRRGFQGAIWPVNPKRGTLGGHPCFATVADLPEAPDAIFLAVPASAAVQTVAALAARGAGGVVCYSAGFREAGEDALEAQLIQATGDMALVGPNCYGVINYLDGVALWPFAHGGTSPGYGAAIITQSGMLSSDISMSQRSLPLTHMISCGNQSVLSLEDFTEHLSQHPAVRAIGLHIEGLRDPARFAIVAIEALRRGVPIVALKTGASQIGASLTASHTGSLSGADDLYNALFARCGVIRVDSPAALLETLKFLCVAGVPKANRVAGFTCSGGGATMLADRAEKIGLTFAPFTPEAKAQLADLLPAIATVSNPLDYTTPIWGDSAKTEPVFRAAVNLAEASSAILVQDYPAVGLDESLHYYRADAAAFIAATKARGIPAAICATLSENLDASTRDWLVAQGVAPMQGLTETLDAIAAATNWGQARVRLLANAPAPLLAARPIGPMIALDEAQGKDRLRALALCAPAGRLVAGAEVAEVDLPFPVVLKMMGPRLAHKSEAGAVAVNLRTRADLIAALTKMRADVTAHDPLALTDSFLVEGMAPKPVAELLVSFRRDAQFGLAMTLGSGGVLVELLDDAATLLLPAPASEILQALQGLKVARLLAGFRGAKGTDLARAAADIANLATAIATLPDLVEAEINPLFIGRDGITIVDVLLYVEQPQ